MTAREKNYLKVLGITIIACVFTLVVLKQVELYYRDLMYERLYNVTNNILINHSRNASTSTETLKGWKTYRSEKYGFELQYPNGFTVEELGVNSYEEQIQKGGQVSGTQAPGWEMRIKSQKQMESLNLLVVDDKNYLALKGEYDWNLRVCGQEGFGRVLSKEQVVFAKQKALKVLSYFNISPRYITYICIKTKTFPIVISFTQQDRNLFDSILSTFKFYDTASSTSDNPFCTQVITKAKNLKTGEFKEFSIACLPAGWVRIES